MTARRRVVLVGAGNIGARHAQGMAGVAAAFDLDIVDPRAEARQRAVSLLTEAGGLRGGAIRDFDRLEDVADAPDLAVIATNARERPDAIRAVVALGARSLILEKVLFTRLSDYDAMDRLLAETGVRAWVNCGNNAAYIQSERLKELVGASPFHYRVEGDGWGLGCNLIHYLNEFATLSGRPDIRLSAADLDPVVVDSKRAGYVEFFGRISGTTPPQNKFTAVCRNGSEFARTVTIDTGERSLTVSTQGTLTISDRNGIRTERYPLLKQSELTASCVEGALLGQALKLPDYASASRLHRTMVTAFLEHLRRVRRDDMIDECPVT